MNGNGSTTISHIKIWEQLLILQTTSWLPGLVSVVGNPHVYAMNGHLEGVPQPYLGNLLAIVINHLLTGVILQVGDKLTDVKRVYSLKLTVRTCQVAPSQ